MWGAAAPKEGSAGDFARRGYSMLHQEGADIGSTAAKLHEGFERIATASAGQNGVQKPRRRVAVEDPPLLESREGIRGEDFRPFVAVVPGRIATGKNMSKAVREAVPLRRPDHGHLAAHLLQHLPHATPALRGVLGVQPEIEQSELELP